MKQRNGFILLVDVVIIGLSALLLTSCVQAFSSCLRLQERSTLLQNFLETAQQAGFNDESSSSYQIEKIISQSGDLKISEVRVSNERLVLNYLQALP